MRSGDSRDILTCPTMASHPTQVVKQKSADINARATFCTAGPKRNNEHMAATARGGASMASTRSVTIFAVALSTMNTSAATAAESRHTDCAPA